jgi:excisionase family DNA binding protein
MTDILTARTLDEDEVDNFMPELMRPRDVADTLDISERTLKKHVDAGRLRVVRIGGLTRFRADDIRDFIVRHQSLVSVEAGDEEAA